MINLQIIGAQKAGTTALASFLNQHPGVYVVEGKEAHVFDHPDYDAETDKNAFIERKYRQRLKGLAQQRVVCDATPITLFNEQFLRACVAYNPSAKFIVMLRDPVERAVSHYRMSFNRGQESRSMLTAFLLEPFRLSALQALTSWSFDSPYRNNSYLSRGRYTPQLERLLKLIPKEQLLVLKQEDLKKHHEETLIKVFRFLDIQKHDIPAETVFSSSPVKRRWSDKLGKLYAKFYFWIHGENQTRWENASQGRLISHQMGE